MDPAGQQRLDRERKELEGSLRWGPELLRRLADESFEPTYIRRMGDAWLVRALAPPRIAERFGLAPEVQLIAARHEVQARDLSRAAADARRARGRLNGDLIIVVTTKSDLRQRLERLPVVQVEGDAIIQQRVAWHLGQGSLEHHLALELPLTDLFDVTDPVHRGTHFGRKGELAELLGSMRQGGGVGIYGLRKVGKTTLARLAESSLRNEGTACAWVDAQGLPSADLSGEGLSRAWLRDLCEDKASSAIDARDPIDQLADALDLWLNTGKSALLTLDEFDLLFQEPPAAAAPPRLRDLFGRLRALSQSQRPGRLAVVFIGRNPQLLSPPLMDGATNPLLAWVRETWLGPLGTLAATEMLRKLGKRCNLTVGRHTAEKAWSWTGGHPLLHRQFGSAALSIARDRNAEERTEPFDADLHLTGIEREFRRKRRARDVGNEVVELLKSEYPAAFDLWLRLTAEDDAQARIEVWRKEGDGDLGPSQTLRELGLVDDVTNTAGFWRWYLDAFVRAPERKVG